MKSHHAGVAVPSWNRGLPSTKSSGSCRAQTRTFNLVDRFLEDEPTKPVEKSTLHSGIPPPADQLEESKPTGPLPRLRVTSQAHPQAASLIRTAARVLPATAAAGNGATGQSSHYRGVSLLRRTGRWHAQINFEGRQVHLGFFGGEEEAAGAYDRALIIKWAAANGGAGAVLDPAISHPSTNLDLKRYTKELSRLVAITPSQLLAALGNEHSRRGAMEALCHGFPVNEAPEGDDASLGTDEGVLGEEQPVTVQPPTPPALIALVPRMKRRKLEIPVRGSFM